MFKSIFSIFKDVIERSKDNVTDEVKCLLLNNKLFENEKCMATDLAKQMHKALTNPQHTGIQELICLSD